MEIVLNKNIEAKIRDVKGWLYDGISNKKDIA